MTSAGNLAIAEAARATGSVPPAEEEIFQVARVLTDTAARRMYLDQVCGDAALRQRLDALLRVHDEEQSFLDRPAAGSIATSPPEPPAQIGESIGPYKLLQELGEGGMGVVYMAEQLEPVARRVALKIIKPGMDTRQIIARFEAERQALALMDHPHIAKVLDAGATPGGRPYFVMELVKGVPITRYCDDRRLSVRQRLELLVPVCQAIQHAHQKGIIHRDIKPTNVLVALYDGHPLPKVIDFGVAKATSQRLTERTMFTAFGQLVGTLEYMSPEQAELNQLDIDTRSDIYSLGVLLYELLTGTTPFDRRQLKDKPLEVVLRIIREEDPPKPSTRLGSSDTLPSIAASRDTLPGSLPKLVRGELDWIVMTSLEKDRNRRYESANSLAADIVRYLRDEPVLACPPAIGYRLGKFARRYRAALATAAVVALAVLLAVGVVGWAVRDRAARASAQEEELAKQHAVHVAVQEKDVERLLEAIRAAYRADELPAATVALEQAERLIEGGQINPLLADQVRAWRKDLDVVLELEDTRIAEVEIIDVGIRYDPWNQQFARTFEKYGIYLSSGEPGDHASCIRRSAVRDHLIPALDQWLYFKRLNNDPLTETLLEVTRLADEDPWRRRIRDAYWRNDQAALVEIASSEELQKQPSATLLLFSRVLPNNVKGPDGIPHVLRILRQEHSKRPTDFWISQRLATLYNRPGSVSSIDAEGYCRAALARRPNHPALRRQLGSILAKQRKFRESDVEYLEAIRLAPEDYLTRLDFCQRLTEQDRLEEAVVQIREVIRLEPHNVSFPMRLGDLHFDLGQVLEAEAAYKQAQDVRPDLAVPHIYLAQNYARSGDFQRAADVYRTALTKYDTASVMERYEGCVLQVYAGNGETNELLGGLVKAVQAPGSQFAAEESARACLLTAEVFGQPAEILKLAKPKGVSGGAPRLDVDNALAHGLIQYRAGQYRDALTDLKAAAPRVVHPNVVLLRRAPIDAQFFIVMAMAHKRLGEAPGARQSLATARKILAQIQVPPAGPRFDRYIWTEWLVAQILLREADALLGADASAGPAPAD